MLHPLDHHHLCMKDPRKVYHLGDPFQTMEIQLLLTILVLVPLFYYYFLFSSVLNCLGCLVTVWTFSGIKSTLWTEIWDWTRKSEFWGELCRLELYLHTKKWQWKSYYTKIITVKFGELIILTTVGCFSVSQFNNFYIVSCFSKGIICIYLILHFPIRTP
jgi:hypothetical protein